VFPCLKKFLKKFNVNFLINITITIIIYELKPLCYKMKFRTLEKNKLDLNLLHELEQDETFQKTNQLVVHSINQMNLYDSERKVMLEKAKEMALEIAMAQPKIFNVDLTKQNIKDLDKKHIKTAKIVDLKPRQEEKLKTKPKTVVKNGTIVDTIVNTAIRKATKQYEQVNSKTKTNTAVSTFTAQRVDIKQQNNVEVKNATLVDFQTYKAQKNKTLVEPKINVKTATLVDNKTKTDTQLNLKEDVKVKNATHVDTKVGTVVDLATHIETKTGFAKTFTDTHQKVKQKDGKKKTEMYRPKISSNIDLSQEVFLQMISERLMQHEGVKSTVATYDIARKFILPRWDQIKASVENSVEDEVNAFNNKPVLVTTVNSSIVPSMKSVMPSMQNKLISRDMDNVNPIDQLTRVEWNDLEADRHTRFERFVNTNQRHKKKNLPKPTF
jgi:hypothetical protein